MKQCVYIRNRGTESGVLLKEQKVIPYPHDFMYPHAAQSRAPVAASFDFLCSSVKQFYTFGEADMLGRGQFGTVCLATDKASGELVAIKSIPRSSVKESSFREETEAHRDLSNHPNIVGLKVSIPCGNNKVSRMDVWIHLMSDTSTFFFR